MRRRERVVDIEIPELGQSLGKLRRIRLLAPVEAKIFEEGDLAGPKGGDHPLCFVADAVRRESHLAAADCLFQRRHQRPQRKSRVRRALGAAEMGHHDDLGTAGDQRLDRRRQPLDAGRVIQQGPIRCLPVILLGGGAGQRRDAAAARRAAFFG